MSYISHDCNRHFVIRYSNIQGLKFGLATIDTVYVARKRGSTVFEALKSKKVMSGNLKELGTQST